MARMASGPSRAARHVRELAEAARRGMGHSYLGEEHLLLGVLAHGHGRAAELLAAHRLTVDSTRDAVNRIATQAGPLAKDDAVLLEEFGVDVEAMRTRLESTFGAPAVREAARAVRRRPWWRGRARRSPLCGPLYVIKRAQMLACTRAGHDGRDHVEPEDLLYGLLRSARDPWGAGMGRRGRREMTRLGLRPGDAHPVRLVVEAHGVDLDDLLGELAAT